MQASYMDIHSKTPVLAVTDPRGLAICRVDYWRCDASQVPETRLHRTARDAAGHPVKQWDPRLWALQSDDPLAPANLDTVYSMNGHVLRSNSVDAGMQISLLGLGSETLTYWDSRGTRRDREHDALLRPTAVFEEGGLQPRRCAERFVYGRPGVADATRNQLGQLLRHDDPAGSVLFDAFAISGENVENTRHFTLEPVSADWPEPIDERQRLLEPGEGAITRWRFGPLGALLEQVDARGNRHGNEWTLDGGLRACHLQLKHQTEWLAVVCDIHYDAERRVTQERAGNGVLTTLTYRQEDGRLIERHAKNSQGVVLQHLLYQYDRTGNVLSIEDRALPVRYFANQRIEPISCFIYDSLYQLSEASGWEAGAGDGGPTAIANYSQRYRYDAGGNLLKLIHVGAQSPGHDLQAARSSNRCLPWRNGVPPDEVEIGAAFDARGNLLLLDQGRRLQWNLRNQLQSVTAVRRDARADDGEVFFYNGHGERVSKMRTLQTHARSVVSQVRYLPALELRTDSGTGEALQVITVQTGLNSIRVLHWESVPPTGVNDQYRYGFSDHLGSISLELDADSRLISREHFYPFGATAWSEESEVSYKTLRYSGKECDATGLYYYGFRYYMPWLQRWLNPDPAGAIDGHNRYRAMRNNPIVYTDGDGRKPGNKNGDRVYHELAEQKLVNPLQAAGMQPVRNYFEASNDPKVQAYRKAIPDELAKLGAKSDSLLNTHEAHVRAAVRTQTASPSGPILYHSGELLSAGMSKIIGEQNTSRIMGPMSVAFNSPTEDPQVLAGRRDAVAKTFKTGGQLLMHAAHPAAQLLGAASTAMGNVMEISEAQTRVQYRMLNTPANVAMNVPGDNAQISFQSFQQTFTLPQQSLFSEASAAPSEWAQQLLAVAFKPPPLQIVHANDDSVNDDEYLDRPRRGSHYG